MLYKALPLAESLRTLMLTRKNPNEYDIETLFDVYSSVYLKNLQNYTKWYYFISCWCNCHSSLSYMYLISIKLKILIKYSIIPTHLSANLTVSYGDNFFVRVFFEIAITIFPKIKTLILNTFYHAL